MPDEAALREGHLFDPPAPCEAVKVGAQEIAAAAHDGEVIADADVLPPVASQTSALVCATLTPHGIDVHVGREATQCRIKIVTRAVADVGGNVLKRGGLLNTVGVERAVEMR